MLKANKKSDVSKHDKSSVKNNVKFSYILADNWFCSKDNINFIITLCLKDLF